MTDFEAIAQSAQLETLVELGCGDCEYRTPLCFPLAASVVLAGVDTTGINLRVRERISISNSGQVNGKISFEHNFVQAGSECTEPCSKEAQIARMAKSITVHANASTPTQR